MSTKNAANLKGTESSGTENNAATIDAKLEAFKGTFKMKILDDIREMIDQLLAKRDRSSEKRAMEGTPDANLTSLTPSQGKPPPPPWPSNAPSPSMAPSPQWPPQMNTPGASHGQRYTYPTRPWPCYQAT
ncbi:hypothetical protein CCACVL1_29756 [Corchorus capsularis]|uniref:Uncharacterized protein n=1 Tax=Corchorus capsularis TaxID=210143 RepID=A0A1R3G0C3_COCAP|nr:hypothetical protein CCACVL1_29756 [Corchorus capsularis]